MVEEAIYQTAQTMENEISRQAEKVYENVKLIRIPKAGHGFDGEDSQFAREQSIEFIRKNLK